MNAPDSRPALWEAMIERAEALCDLVVLSQQRPTTKAVARIKRLASDIAALARAARIVGRQT